MVQERLERTWIGGSRKRRSGNAMRAAMWADRHQRPVLTDKRKLMRTATILQEISELLTDSQRGFNEAADRLGEPELKELLMKLGNSRAPMIEELANELARMHENVPMEGTALADLHRTWNSIKGTLFKSEPASILGECERNEKHLLERYDDAINDQELPQHIRTLLREHRVSINADLNGLMMLEKTILK